LIDSPFLQVVQTSILPDFSAAAAAAAAVKTYSAVGTPNSF